MKLIIIEFPDEKHVDVVVRDGDKTLSVSNLDTFNEALAFSEGFRTAQSIINGLVQSLPKSFEIQQSAPTK